MTIVSQISHFNVKTHRDLEEKCLAEMAENGVPFVGPLDLSGEVQRFSRDEKGKQRDEWYIAYGGESSRGCPYLNVVYGSWSDNSKFTFSSRLDNHLSLEDRKEIQGRMAEAKSRTEATLTAKYERAAEEAQKKWQSACTTSEEAAGASNRKPQPSPEDYLQYSIFKGIEPYGARFVDNPYGYPAIVIPLFNMEGKIRSLQFISKKVGEKSFKSFLEEGEKKGNFFVLGKLQPNNYTLVCEGWATGCSLHEATGFSVVIAFDSGNLEAVVANIRKFSDLPIIIAGDDDVEKPENKGRRKAEEAAAKHGCKVVFPTFDPEKKRDRDGKIYTDFNDLMCTSGLQEVKRQILEAVMLHSSEPLPGNEKAVRADWVEPKPIKASLFPVPPFDSKILLPEVLRGWIMDEADRMPCPPDFIASAVLVSLGAIIGARCAIRPKANDPWLIIPNLWGGIVGLPSAKKSPAIGVALKPLDRLIAHAMAQQKASTGAYEAEKTVFEAKKDAIESKIKAAAKNPKNGNVDSFAKELIHHQQNSPKQPTLRRYKSNDTTVEKLGELLRENPTGLLVLRDELVGLIASWDKAGREGDRAFYLEAWNGNASFDTDRIGRGSIFIPNLCTSLFGGIQPDKLTIYLEQSAHALANDGMLQRFQVLVYPDHREWEWRDRFPDKEASGIAYTVFDAIADFDPVDWGASPKDDYAKFPYFHFNEEAQKVFIEWSTDLNRAKLPIEDNPLIAQHLAKHDKLFAGLALIFHLVDCAASGNRGPVKAESALRSAAWCKYFEAHARRCYGLLADDGLRSAQVLSDKLSKGKLSDGFTARDVRRNQWRHLTTDEAVQAALDWLEDDGWLRGNEVGGAGPGTGRRTTRYLINPKVKKLSETEGEHDELV